MHDVPSVAIVGQGRLGTALAAALRRAGLEVHGPHGREADGAGADLVLLCVPDTEIEAAVAHLAHGRLVGHCSGATTLEPLAGHEAFSLHPLMTVPDHGASFAGATAAIAGATPRALRAARDLAERLGMRPIEVADEDRAAYHAAASIAANYLVALQDAAERVAATAGIDRAALAPLVRASADNWAVHGAELALTGPIARGDEDTLVRQRAAVAQRTPELLDLFDALAEATRDVAMRGRAPAAATNGAAR